MIDWDRPYGEVIGMMNGCRYEQDGKYYRGDGSPMEPEKPATTGGLKVEKVIIDAEAPDVDNMTKLDLINFAYNKFDRKLDHRSSLASLRTQVKNLME
jgi:hypothetical protein